MRASLHSRLETQIKNELALNKGHLLEYESLRKLGAMMYSEAGQTVDSKHLKECKRILKSKVGLFSNFRSHLEFIVRIKMALSDDPNAYIDGVLNVYQQLKEGMFLPGESVAMAATTIFDNCPPEELDKVIDQTREAYDLIKEQHRFLTGEEDLAMIALMIMAGKDPIEAANQAEELYVALKDRFLIGSDTPQTAALVLALSDKPSEQKVQDFIDLYDSCKATKCATAKDKAMAIYAAFADLDVDRSQLVAEIGEVDAWLKKQKGYGALGVGKSVRRLLAAAFVLEDHQTTDAAFSISTTSAVTQAIVEELLLILISIIITSAIISASVNSTH